MGKFNKAGFCEDSHESAELVGPPSLVPGAHGSQDRRRPGCAVRAPEKGRALGLGKLPLARAATSQVDVECFPVLKAFPFFLYPQQLLNEENLRKQEESVQKQEAMRQGGFRSARGCLRGCVRGGRAQAGRARRARRASCHGGGTAASGAWVLRRRGRGLLPRARDRLGLICSVSSSAGLSCGQSSWASLEGGRGVRLNPPAFPGSHHGAGNGAAAQE